MSQLHEPGDQRKHYTDIPVGARANDGPQLRPKHREMLQTVSNRAQTQKRILLRFPTWMALVPAEIHGTDDQRTAAEGLSGRTISFELLLFCRRMAVLHKEELGSK